MADALASEAPYVGPRPFERTAEDRARFFGRDEETGEIVSLVMAHPAVLVYAQSGAGKTSLFNARIAPELEKRGFEVLPLTRVRRVVPPAVNTDEIANLYMYCALLAWAPEADPISLAADTLTDFLAKQPRATTTSGRPMPRVIIFDQFEELFGFYPKDWRRQQDDFFRQVADALAADPLLRAVFVIREDYLAQLDPFVDLLPEELRVRFRVERLREPDALMAVTGPLAGTGCSYAPGVAEELVHELLQARVLGPDGQPAEVEGQYVEPVQLQVVCLSLWNSLPPGTTEITHEQLQKFGDVDQALARFYVDSLQQAVKEGGVSESALRDWFSTRLITSASTRGTVFRGPTDTAGIPNTAVDVLDRQHIIRREERAGAGWYELTHDRFIEPIQASNAAWRDTRTRRMVTWAIVAAGVAALVIFSGLALGGRYATSRAISTAEAVAAATAQAQAEATATVAAENTREAEEQATSDAARRFSDHLRAGAEQQAASLDLALLLAVEALRAADTEDARQTMQSLLQSWPGVQRYVYAHDASVDSLAFSYDGAMLGSGDASGTLAVWTELASDPTNTIHSAGLPIQGISLSGSGPPLAAGPASLPDDEGEPPPPSGRSSEGSGGMGGRGNLVGLFRTAEDVWPAQYLVSGGEFLTGLAVSPDGRLVAAVSDSVSGDGSSIAGTLTLWRTPSSEADAPIPGVSFLERAGSTTAISFSSDSRTLAVGGEAGQVAIWTDLEARQPTKEVLPIGAVVSSTVSSLAFDPTGALLAIGFDDGQFVVWDRERGQPAFDPVDASEVSVESLAFDVVNDTVVVLFADGSLSRFIFADLVSGDQSPASRTQPVLGTRSAALTSDGQSWGLGLDTGAIVLGRSDEAYSPDVNADPEALIERACRIANRNLYPIEWNLFIGEDVPYQETCPEVASTP